MPGWNAPQKKLQVLSSLSESDHVRIRTYLDVTPIEEVLKKAVVLRSEGKRVDVQACVPQKKKYAQEMKAKGDS